MNTETLRRFLPASIVAYVAEKKEKLSQKEMGVLDRMSARYFDTGIWKKKTEEKVVVAMVGLQGSGKTTIAKRIAQQIGGTVISSDEIRTELSKAGLPYTHVNLIALELGSEALRGGGNPVFDSDFIDADKRARLKMRIGKEAAKVIFVRTVCDPDIMSQRIRSEKPDEFYQGASTKSTAEDHGVDVKFREWWRRTPLHYKGVPKDGNSWELRKLGFDHAVINTDNKDKAFLGLTRVLNAINP